MLGMRAISSVSVLGLCLASVLACTPELNWREARFDDAALVTLMPCKPDRAKRLVPLRAGTQQVMGELHMQGCQAHDLQFTFSQITLPPEVPAQEAVVAWRTASLAALGAADSKAEPRPWAIKGAATQVTPVQWVVQTDAHQAVCAWFMHGNKLYQAAVYGVPHQRDVKDIAETCFSGIKLP